MAKKEFQNHLRDAGLRLDAIPADYLSPPTFKLEGTEPIDILQTYEGLQQSVRCAYGHPHKTGAVVRFKCGNTHIIGHECAEKYFGDKWRHLQKSHRAREDHVLNTSLVAPNLALLGRIYAQLLLLQKVAHQKDTFLYDLGRACPSLLIKLQETAKAGGIWQKTITEKTWDDSGEYNPRASRVTAAGHLFGSHAIAINAMGRLTNCYRHLQQADAEYRKTPITIDNTREGRRLIDLILDITSQLVPELRAGKEFFSRGALEQLVAVSKKDPDWRKRIGLKAQALKVDRNGYGDFIDVPIPVDYPANFKEIEAQLTDLERPQ